MDSDNQEVETGATAVPDGTPPHIPDHDPHATSHADAIERRLRQQREAAAAQSGRFTAFDQHHEKRQNFRRLIEPGILRRNPKHISLEAMRILVKLSDNIIDHPDEPKYFKFKPTNEKIKAYLVDPKGTLEYAVALGFRPEVENFQPFYIFNKRFMTDMKIGNAIIKEFLELEDTKTEQQERARREEKAARDAAKDKVKQAFMEDRMSTAQRVERETIAREARVAAGQTASPQPARRTSRAPRIHGSGQTLTGEVVSETPPPYSRRDDEDADADAVDEEDEEE